MILFTVPIMVKILNKKKVGENIGKEMLAIAKLNLVKENLKSSWDYAIR